MGSNSQTNTMMFIFIKIFIIKMCFNILPKKIHTWTINPWKAHRQMSLGSCKWIQWDPTTHLRMAKTQTMDTTKHWWAYGGMESLLCCGWECKMVQPLGRQSRSFLPNWTYSSHTIQHSCSLVFAQTGWNRMSTQNLHMDVDGSFFYSCQNLEATQMSSLGKWKNCSNPDSGILLSI